MASAVAGGSIAVAGGCQTNAPLQDGVGVGHATVNSRRVKGDPEQTGQSAALAGGPVVRAWIDEPAGDAPVTGPLVRVSGWAFDEAGLLDEARLVIGGGVASEVRLGIWRPDLADAFPGVPHAAASGFEGSVDLRAASTRARLALIVRRGDGPWVEAAATSVALEEPAGEPTGRRRRAAFTIVHNESVWLKPWLEYYLRHFAADDIYVLDHGSDDGSTAGVAPGVHVIAVHREAAYDHHWLKTVVEDFQSFLLRSHEVVLFAEADEFIVANPIRHAGLGAYIEALVRPAARCCGFNVVHLPDEPALRFGEPLLRQRRYWHASADYSKRLVGRIPLRWSDGFHHEYNAPDDAPDPDLLLVHMHRADHDACLGRHRASAARSWNAADLASGAGAQNRIAEPAEFERWFRAGDATDAPRELIPDHIRALL